MNHRVKGDEEFLVAIIINITNIIYFNRTKTIIISYGNPHLSKSELTVQEYYFPGQFEFSLLFLMPRECKDFLWVRTIIMLKGLIKICLIENIMPLVMKVKANF